MKQSGIDAVSGQVVVDDRLFQSSLADEPITPIIINQNIIDFTTTPGEVGETGDHRHEPGGGAVDGHQRGRDRRPPAGTTEIEIDSPEEGQVVLTGTIAADSDPVLKVHVLEDPATFARTAFIEALGAGRRDRRRRPGGDELDGLARRSGRGRRPAVGRRAAVAPARGGRDLRAEGQLQPRRPDVGLPAGRRRPASNEPARRVRGWLEGGPSCGARPAWTPRARRSRTAPGLEGNLVTPANQTELQMIMAKRPDAERWRATLPILGRRRIPRRRAGRQPGRGQGVRGAGAWSAERHTVAGDELRDGPLRRAAMAWRR